MSKLKSYSVGIIGNGHFGQVLANLFRLSHPNLTLNVKIASRTSQIDHETIFPLVEVLNCDFVFPCIPISTLEDFLNENRHHITNNNSTYVDVCSVKELPTKWLTENLPSELDIVSSHPLFGPSSTDGGKNFAGLKFVIHPYRVRMEEKYSDLISFLKHQKITLIDLSPAEHDMQVAYTQAFGFLIGWLGHEVGVYSTSIDTKWFELLYQNQQMVVRDTRELFHDMFNYNNYALEMLDKAIQELNKLREEVLRTNS